MQLVYQRLGLSHELTIVVGFAGFVGRRTRAAQRVGRHLLTAGLLPCLHLTLKKSGEHEDREEPGLSLESCSHERPYLSGC